jgi:hypothetical protein
MQGPDFCGPPLRIHSRLKYIVNNNKYISYFAAMLIDLVSFFLGVYDFLNPCMFICVISHLNGLQVGCSRNIIEMLSYGIW